MKTFQFRSSLTVQSIYAQIQVEDEVLDFTTEASNIINALVNYLLENADALEGAKVEIVGAEEDTVLCALAPVAYFFAPQLLIQVDDEESAVYSVEYIVAEESLGTAT